MSKHLQNCIETAQKRLIVAQRNKEEKVIAQIIKELEYYREQIN